MTENNTAVPPGFWRICFADAYLFKMCCIFLPLLLALIVYDMAAGKPFDDYLLPVIFSAGLIGMLYSRWSAIAHTFKDHEVLASRISDIAPGTGLFGLQLYVSFHVRCDGSDADRGCFLVKFNPRVKKLQKGDPVSILWNRKRMYIVKEAYLD